VSIQVGSGLTPPDSPDNVPDAVEIICKHSQEEESRKFFAEDLIRGNLPLYTAISEATRKENGRDLIWNMEDATKALLRWAKFADDIGQFKPRPT
jgi:hypothetical protein